MEKEFDHEITVKVSEVEAYFDGAEFGYEFTTILDQAQGDARTNGKPQRILLTIEPDTEELQGRADDA
jgi:hypothetical protein